MSHNLARWREDDVKYHQWYLSCESCCAKNTDVLETRQIGLNWIGLDRNRNRNRNKLNFFVLFCFQLNWIMNELLWHCVIYIYVLCNYIMNDMHQHHDHAHQTHGNTKHTHNTQFDKANSLQQSNLLFLLFISLIDQIGCHYYSLFASICFYPLIWSSSYCNLLLFHVLSCSFISFLEQFHFLFIIFTSLSSPHFLHLILTFHYII